MARRKLVSLLVLAGATIMLTSMVTSQTAAGSVSTGSGENDTVTNSNTVTAQGGNVTNANVTIDSITNKWSAFYGQLTSTERLSDASGNNFYQWTVDNPTASGSNVYAVPSGQGAPSSASLGAVSNPDTFLGAEFNSGADSASNTFNETRTLDSVSTAAADTFVSDSPSDTFTSGLANDTTNTANSSVYLAEVQQDSTGFDGNTHDFQLLVGVGESTANKDFDFYAKIG